MWMQRLLKLLVSLALLYFGVVFYGHGSSAGLELFLACTAMALFHWVLWPDTKERE